MRFKERLCLWQLVIDMPIADKMILVQTLAELVDCTVQRTLSGQSKVEKQLDAVYQHHRLPVLWSKRCLRI